MNIVKNIWQAKDHPLLKEPGKMSKWNLNCGSKMCHPKYNRQKQKKEYG